MTVDLKMRSTEILEDPDVDDFAAYLGFSPIAAVNLTMADESRDAAQIIRELAGITDMHRRRAYRMRLALSRRAEAEEYLIAQLRESNDDRDIEELAEALATLGTLKARDALLAATSKFEARPKVLATLLKALFDLPIAEGAETILRFAAPSYERGQGERRDGARAGKRRPRRPYTQPIK